MPSTLTLFDASDPSSSVIFPVTPLPEANDASVKLSWSVARRGGISRPHGRNERTFSFTADLPGILDANQPYISEWSDPDDILERLRGWHAPVAKQGTKLKMVLERATSVRDDVVYIDTIKAVAAARGGYLLSLSLVEWRTMFVSLDGEGSTPKDGPGDSDQTAPAPPDTPDQYAVQDGDTLYDIAATQLGDGDRWPEIAQLNSIDDPENLQIGTVLQLPSSTPGDADTSDPDPDA